MSWDPWLPRCTKNLARSCQDSQDASKRVNPGTQNYFLLLWFLVCNGVYAIALATVLNLSILYCKFCCNININKPRNYLKYQPRLKYFMSSALNLGIWGFRCLTNTVPLKCPQQDFQHYSCFSN